MCNVTLVEGNLLRIWFILLQHKGAGAEVDYLMWPLFNSDSETNGS